MGKIGIRDFPGNPGLGFLAFIAGAMGLIPGQGNKISHAKWPK